MWLHLSGAFRLPTHCSFHHSFLLPKCTYIILNIQCLCFSIVSYFRSFVENTCVLTKLTVWMIPFGEVWPCRHWFMKAWSFKLIQSVYFYFNSATCVCNDDFFLNYPILTCEWIEYIKFLFYIRSSMLFAGFQRVPNSYEQGWFLSSQWKPSTYGTSSMLSIQLHFTFSRENR